MNEVDKLDFITPYNLFRALARAEAHENLPDEIHLLPGFTGLKVQEFLNYLCSHPATRYLEIGCLHGATLLAASYGNPGKFTGVDNFSLQPGEIGLYANMEKFKAVCTVDFHRADCWTIDKALIPDDINVYFYDGDHSEESQKKALTHWIDKMASEFFFIVDDWGRAEVRDGTLDALAELKTPVTAYAVLAGSVDREGCGDFNGWWAGVGIFLLRNPTNPNFRTKDILKYLEGKTDEQPTGPKPVDSRHGEHNGRADHGSL